MTNPPPPPPIVQEIIVTGQVREIDHSGLFHLVIGSWLNPSGPVSENVEPPPYMPIIGTAPLPTGDIDTGLNASVSIQLTDINNQSKALAVAQKFAQGFSGINSKLSNALGGHETVAGRNIPATDALYKLNNTKWILVDDAYFTDGAAAKAIPGSPPTVYLNLFQFDNENGSDYGSYNGLEGFMGVSLHEVGHLSDAGDLFSRQNYDAYFLEYGDSIAQYAFDTIVGGPRGDYGRNAEAFANSYAANFAMNNGLDISDFSDTVVYGVQTYEPWSIYSGHTGMRSNGDGGSYEVLA